MYVVKSSICAARPSDYQLSGLHVILNSTQWSHATSYYQTLLSPYEGLITKDGLWGWLFYFSIECL